MITPFYRQKPEAQGPGCVRGLEQASADPGQARRHQARPLAGREHLCWPFEQLHPGLTASAGRGSGPRDTRAEAGGPRAGHTGQACGSAEGGRPAPAYSPSALGPARAGAGLPDITSQT